MICITILDEVNCVIDGLEPQELRRLQDSIKFKEKGAHMTAAFRLGEWDGFVSMVEDDGVFALYHIDQVIEFVVGRLGYGEDEIDLVDERPECPVPDDVPPVDDTFLLKYTGHTLRDYQVDGINDAIYNRKGILHLATSAGKTALTLGISKLLDPYIKTITIVPSAQLAKQTYDDYQLCEDIKSCLLTAKDSQQKRLDKIKENRHFVITEKLFLNLIDEFKKDTYAVMKDECHVLGTVLEEALRYRTPHYPIRIGLTGTIPTDLHKAERIKCVLGGGVLRHVPPAELISRGLAAKPTIKLVTVSHKEIESLFKTMRDEKEFEWSIEQNYMSKNVERAEAIATYINKVFKDDTKNTLVLCHAAFGKVLSKVMNLPIITDDVSVDERREMFSRFKTEDGHIQLASFGTSSTGISENRIFRLIMIDVGKDETTIIQSIGRGIRLDGVHNKVDVIDISSNTFYSTKHRKERIKVYKREKYDYHEDSNFIYV